jgi:hypothetical protein
LISLLDILSLVEVIVLLAGGFISLQIYTFNQRNKLWLTVPIGFIFMALRRILLFLSSLGIITDKKELVLWLDSVILPFAITALLFIGVLSMYKAFQEFDSLEGQLASKLDKGVPKQKPRRKSAKKKAKKKASKKKK